MRKSRLRILVGITFSSLLIGQVGVISVYAYSPSSLEEVEEERWDGSDERGFYITPGLDSYGNYIYHLDYYNGDNVNVEIPNHVIDIRNGAFSISNVNTPNENGRKIQSVKIPNNRLEVIGDNCFKGCTELTKVEFEKTEPVSEHGLEIGYSAFEGCTSLKSIDLSSKMDRITKVGMNAFAGCTSLEEVTLSKGMTEIPSGMFKDCTSLQYIEIPDTIEHIDEDAFSGIENLTIVCSTKSGAVEKYLENHKNVQTIYTDSSSFEKEPKIYLDVESEGDRILRFLDDEDFSLGAHTKYRDKIKNKDVGIFSYASDRPDIVSVNESGLVSIHGIGMAHINIKLNANSSIFKDSYHSVTIIVTRNGEDPVIPPDIDPDNPDDPSNPEKPDNPSNPTNPDNPGNSDSGTTPGGGDSNQNTGNENTDSSQSKEQKIEVKKIEVTYGDSPFTIQPGKDMGTKVSFSSSNKKVFTVSSKGKITIKGCGSAKLKMKSKTATKTFEIVVKPKKNSITSLEIKKRNITVKWPRDKKADGYYIYYSTDSKFKKSVKKVQIPKNKTVQYTIKKLKSGKKYYVRLYSYKKSGKNVILSDASKTKNIKVK